MLVILPIIFYFLNTAQLPQTSMPTAVADSEYTIYLVKISWHTGIVFRTDEIDTTIWKSLNNFKDFKYVDVGWGDKDFYQAPGFEIDLAVKALFIKTESTLRVAGINRQIEDYIKYTDFAEKIHMNREEYNRLCRFIQSTYKLKNNSPQILSEPHGGSVKFYLASGYYTIFNTCNTWVAKGLKSAGYNIDDNIILSGQLFRETIKYGKMVKLPE